MLDIAVVFDDAGLVVYIVVSLFVVCIVPFIEFIRSGVMVGKRNAVRGRRSRAEVHVVMTRVVDAAATTHVGYTRHKRVPVN